MNRETIKETVCKAGIDIGSTTVKLVISDEENRLLFGEYKRHMAHTKDAFLELLTQAAERLGDRPLQVHLTGSGALGYCPIFGNPFYSGSRGRGQGSEKLRSPHRCGGGTGGRGRQDHLFHGRTGGTNERRVCRRNRFLHRPDGISAADRCRRTERSGCRRPQAVYPIAARCGVFAKTDIQPLINDGADQVADLAASVFQAVVNQTVSADLACGKPIRGQCGLSGRPPPLSAGTEKSICTNTEACGRNEVIDPGKLPSVCRHGRRAACRSEPEGTLLTSFPS